MEIFNFWTNLANHPFWFKLLIISGMLFWGCIIVCILVVIFANAHANEPPNTKVYEKSSRLV